jgi:GNAT superfamily N-acetyltransferase
MHMPHNAHKLTPDDTQIFDQLIAIYQSSIEISEQRQVSSLNKFLRDPRYTFLVTRENDVVTAFAIMFFPRCGAFWLLDYMAVDKRLRSRGLGEALFSATQDLAAQECAARRAPGVPCLIEVDQPAADATPNDDPRRRLEFYSRMQCRIISGLRYRLPLAVAGEPPPMSLLIHSLDHADSITKTQLRRWLTTLYSEAYECSENDERIDMMVSELKDTIPLERLSFSKPLATHQNHAC